MGISQASRKSSNEHQGGMLEVVRAGIDTYQESVVYMREDCSVCRSEGFAAQARIRVSLGDRSIIATLNVVSGDWLKPHQAALSESAWQKLRPAAGARVSMSHADPVSSMNRIRAKIYGERLVHADYLEIMRDCVAGRLADIELATFLTACATATRFRQRRTTGRQCPFKEDRRWGDARAA